METCYLMLLRVQESLSKVSCHTLSLDNNSLLVKLLEFACIELHEFLAHFVTQYSHIHLNVVFS